MRWAPIQTICPPYQLLLTSFPDRNRRTRYRPIQSRDDCCTCQAFCFISKRLRMSLATPQDPFRRPLSRRSKSCRCHSFPFVYSQSGLSFRILLSWIASVFIWLPDSAFFPTSLIRFTRLIFVETGYSKKSIACIIQKNHVRKGKRVIYISITWRRYRCHWKICTRGNCRND